MWNLLYDDLLHFELLTDVQMVAFVDDVALVTTAEVTYQLEVRIGAALVIVTQRRKWNTMVINFCGHTSASKKSVKYLGVQVDSRLYFHKYTLINAS